MAKHMFLECMTVDLGMIERFPASGFKDNGRFALCRLLYHFWFHHFFQVGGRCDVT